MADPHAAPPAAPDAEPFRPGLVPNLKFDILSGFLVFLIALPLCLAIANGYRFPPIAGVWTAVLGGILTTFISNSQMTIKGPAAGMLVIVVGAVNGFEADIVRDLMGNPGATPAQVKEYLDAQPEKGRYDVWRAAYENALGVAVVAGVIQILFGLFRAGVLAELCPMTPIHALLASIGIIIMFKMAYQLTGTSAPPGDEAIHAVIGLPAALPHAVRDVTVVGLTGLTIMIGWGFVRNRRVKQVPAQLVVLLVCVPLALALGLQHVLKPDGSAKYLVPIKDVLADPRSAFAFPVFDRILTWTGVQSVILFALIGSLESVLSAKAVDLIDPFRRKTDLNRDILAVGVANTACAVIGAPPMISEIVRSKANIDNGARTKYADLFHGLFLLLAAVFLSALLAKIPLAALAAMLVYTGYRLAHPREFVNTYKIGPEQLVVFLVTIVTILATDLLIGFLAGVGAKFLFHLLRGVGPGRMFRADVEILDQDEAEVELRVRGAAVFSNWLGLKRKILAVADGKAVVVDLSRAKFVDHSTMEKLHELEMEYRAKGRGFEVRGLDRHVPVSNHPLAARKLGAEKTPVG